jgi:hypothetical protein
MGYYVESTAASNIPKSVLCRYDTYFKVMVIRHAEETRSMPQHGNSLSLNTEETK